MTFTGASSHPSSYSSYHSSSYSDLRGYLYDGVSLEEFVEQVWGLPQEVIAEVLQTPCVLDAQSLSTYKKACDDPKRYGIPRRPYQELCARLLRTIKESLGEESASETLESASHRQEAEEWRQNLLTTDCITVLSDRLALLSNSSCSCCASSSLATAGQKRRRSSSHEESTADRVEVVVSPRFTNGETLLISEASLAMSVSSRHYVTGMYIDWSTATLWYFDRTCIIKTVSFDFFQSPQRLALVTYALDRRDCRYGFDPFLVPADSTSLTKTGYVRIKEITGANMFFPTLCDAMGTRFRIEDELIHSSLRLVGRGTTVYHASKLFRGETWENDLALKLSWPTTSRLSESAFLMKLAYTLPPRLRAHLPQIAYHDIYTAEELELPRVKLLYCLPWNFEDRRLSVLVTPIYQPLWEVDNIKEFEAVFIHCVTVHYHAYKTARILHRDISENNLMFHRFTSGVDGVLNDWDMAGLVNRKGVVDAEGVPTGTIPFMAIDILQDDPPPHRYQHDLESFFYLLVWAAVHFDIRNKIRVPTRPVALRWQCAPFHDAVTAKRMFLYDEKHMNTWYDNVMEGFQGIWEDWIIPLRTLFADSTLGGDVGFDNFMAVLRRPSQTSNDRR